MRLRRHSAHQITSWNNAAICSIVLFSYGMHSMTGIEYGVLLHKSMQWFCTWKRCSSRISFISSKQTNAVARPSAKLAFDSLLPPLKLWILKWMENVSIEKPIFQWSIYSFCTYSSLSMVFNTFCGLENGPYVLQVTPGKPWTVLYTITPYMNLLFSIGNKSCSSAMPCNEKCSSVGTI